MKCKKNIIQFEKTTKWIIVEKNRLLCYNNEYRLMVK